jgi:hypothetical protein
MEIGTINGRDWGLDFTSGKPTALGYSFSFSHDAENRGVVFIDLSEHSNGYAQLELNVIVYIDPDEADSTDCNPCRQYATPVADLLDSIALMHDIAAQTFRVSSLNQVDRHLVTKLKFTRVI